MTKKKGELTEKQAAFVKIYLTNGRNGAEAYRKAYNAKKASDKTAANQAYKLLNHPDIAPIIDGVTEHAREAAGMSVERLSEMYYKAYNLSMIAAQMGAAVGAITGLAKLHGFLAEKHEHRHRHEDALEEMARRRAEAIAVERSGVQH
ncbi:MAG: terminase small subunit [Alphaproteobacteria bacterium GM202ARS2]|nr:terminase small subunit [Alphaproteobacteria bacterium GM202ARS2]